MALPVLPDPQSWTPGNFVTSSALNADIVNNVQFFAQRPVAQLSALSTTTTMTYGSWTAATFDTQNLDSYGGWTSTTNPTRYTAQVPGWYLISGILPFNYSGSSSVGVFEAGIQVNGSTQFQGGTVSSVQGHFETPVIYELVNLNQGDYIELIGWQKYSSSNTGTTVTTSAQNTPSFKVPQITIQWVCNQTPPDYWSNTRQPPVPMTWTNGRLQWTAANLNSQVRDAFTWYLYPPTARLYQSTTQTLSALGSWNKITLNNSTFDNYAGHSNTTNNTRYTAPRAGLYSVFGQASFAQASGGLRGVALLVNNASQYIGQCGAPNGGGNDYNVVQQVLRLNPGDYVELQGWTPGSIALTTSVGNAASRLILTYVSP